MTFYQINSISRRENKYKNIFARKNMEIISKLLKEESIIERVIKDIFFTSIIEFILAIYLFSKYFLKII